MYMLKMNFAAAETTGSRSRAMCGFFIQMPAAIGVVLMAVSSFVLRHFRYLHIEMAILYCFTFSYVLWVLYFVSLIWHIINTLSRLNQIKLKHLMHQQNNITEISFAYFQLLSWVTKVVTLKGKYQRGLQYIATYSKSEWKGCTFPWRWQWRKGKL